MAANSDLPPGCSQQDTEGAGDGKQDERAEELDQAVRCFVDKQLSYKSSGWHEFLRDIRNEWYDLSADGDWPGVREFRQAVFETMKNHMV